MDLEHFIIQMGVYMKVIEKRDKNMEKENILPKMEISGKVIEFFLLLEI